MRTSAIAALVLVLGVGADVRADETTTDPAPAIALLIDDMGENRAAGLRAIALPGAVTYSFLPYRTHVAELAQQARAHHKEIVLHLPMEAVDGRALGAGALTTGMSEQELIATLRDSLAAVPHAAGINNHMGSLLTRHPVYMMWLMRAIGGIGDLYFVDSRTTADSVASGIAAQLGVPSLDRDVFLDNEPAEQAITAQFQRLIDHAREHGAALGIGHPYEATLNVLETQLPRLQAAGVRLVPVSALIERRGGTPVRVAKTGAGPPHTGPRY